MIVFLEDFSQIGFGGGQRFTLAIINCIKQQTSRIQIFHLGSNHLFTQRLSADKTSANNIFFNCVSPESHLFGRLYFILALFVKLFRHKNVTIISCTKFTTLVLAFLVQFLPSNSQNKYILFHHLIPPSHPLLRFVYFQIFQRPEFHSIFPSKYLLNRFRTSFPILHKTSVSPIPTIGLPPCDQLASPTPIKTNISTSRPALRFLYVGMVHPDKGLFTLLDLLSRFHSAHPSIHFCIDIYGSGNDKYIRELLHKIPSLSFSVSYFGSSLITSSLYNKASCLFVPSWKHVETLCFTALEGIRYCSHNIFADNGVLPDYDVFDNVILSHDNFRSFSEALLNTINCLENPAQKNDKRITMDSIKIEDDFCAFWKQLVPKY